jgi:cytoskeletal protein RodZ
VTKISLRTLALVEEARLDALPARVFVIGYITAFARVVGCPASEALDRLTRDHPPA